jgi:hypothetical protein
VASTADLLLSLPPLGGLIEDARQWWYPSRGREGIARLRVWTAGSGFLAVVTELGIGVNITNAISDIWQILDEDYGGPLILAEHWPAAQAGSTGEHLDLVQARDDPPAWCRLWPSPCHAAAEAWMAASGHIILAPPAGPAPGPDNPGPAAATRNFRVRTTQRTLMVRALSARHADAIANGQARPYGEALAWAPGERLIGITQAASRLPPPGRRRDSRPSGQAGYSTGPSQIRYG